MALNSAFFSWKEIEVRIAGIGVTGAEALQYDENVSKEFVYGTGTKPLKIKKGNESVSGSITLLQGEYEKLAANSPGGKITNLRNVSIQFSFSDEGDNIVTHSINGVEFTREGFNAQQGQTSLQTELPFMALGVVVTR